MLRRLLMIAALAASGLASVRAEAEPPRVNVKAPAPVRPVTPPAPLPRRPPAMRLSAPKPAPARADLARIEAAHENGWRNPSALEAFGHAVAEPGFVMAYRGQSILSRSILSRTARWT